MPPYIEYAKGGMLLSEEGMEPRKDERFALMVDAYAALSGSQNRLAQIADISLRGLAFDYISSKIRHKSSLWVDIIITDPWLILQKLSCVVVYDRPVEPFFGMDADNDNVGGVRRCGVAFGALAQEELSGVEYIIENYTAGKQL